MTPPKRSTLKLDLKDLKPRALTPNRTRESKGFGPKGLGRIGLVVIPTLTLVITIISINSPSASVSELDYPQIETITAQKRPATPAPAILLASTVQAVANSSSNTANTSVASRNIPYRSIRKRGNRKSISEKIMAEANLVKKGDNQISFQSVSDINQLAYNRSEPQNKPLQLANATLSIPENEIDPAAGLVDLFPANNPGTAILQDATAESIPVAGAQQLPEQKPVNWNWQTERVRKNDTLSQIFNRLGLGSREAYALVAMELAAPLGRIQPGEEIKVVTQTSQTGSKKVTLRLLHYKLDQFNTLVVNGTENGFQIHTETREPVVRIRTEKATIWSSLLGAAKEENIPHDVVYDLTSIFGWQVDFAKNIHGGDQFAVIFEELYLDDKRVGVGNVIAAELITGDKLLRAVRHVDEDQRVSYYTPEGNGIQGSFLRTPIKFGRVTSKFSNKRYHPILKKWRAHKGVDYGASMKTPILATGDGVVRFAGTKNGYGRTLILRHGGKYETVYAHMNNFKKGIRSGARVKQGDVIGYVGKTGWATGPHLHYEFRVNGRHMNPLTVELPKSAAIDDRYRTQFRQYASNWVAQLDQVNGIPLAKNDQ